MVIGTTHVTRIILYIIYCSNLVYQRILLYSYNNGFVAHAVKNS